MAYTRRQFVRSGAAGGLAAGLVGGAIVPAAQAHDQVNGQVRRAANGHLAIPAQSVPPPASVSPEGRAFWEAAAQRIAQQRAGIEQVEDNGIDPHYFERIAEGFEGTMETIALPSGARLYRVIPDGRDERAAEVAYVDIHGGGFTRGGGLQCQQIAKARARDYGVMVYAIDYRLMPDNPYPAGLDDCVDAYTEILRSHAAETIVVGGSSAGGNLAAALMLRIKAEGLALPKGLLLLTPSVDRTRSGDSFHTNRYLDVAIGRGDGPEDDPATSYGGNTNLDNPYVSPLFGDLSGFPPTLLTTGTRDLLLSDTVRMHRALRRAGRQTELLVTDGGCHIGFGGRSPEDREIIAECLQFCRRAWEMQA